MDLGWAADELRSLPAVLGLKGVDVRVSEVRRGGLRGLRVRVDAGSNQPLRNMHRILPVIDGARMPERVKARVKKVFSILCKAEARAHGIPEGKVHFHEMGAVDTIVDVAGVVLGLDSLGISRVVSSSLPVSQGWVDSSHGPLPLPAPACAELLKGVPVYGVKAEVELVTPTGIALLKALAHEFGPFPEMTIRGVGYGAGARERMGVPNLLRIWIGRAEGPGSAGGEPVCEIRTHIDDMNPQWYGRLSSLLFDAGALDVAVSPLQMKKGRPGATLIVLGPLQKERELCDLVLEHSTTLGVRVTTCRRRILPRSRGVVKTRWGPVGAKLVKKPGGREIVVPEHDDCLRVAEERGLSLDEVYREVIRMGEEGFHPLPGEDR